MISNQKINRHLKEIATICGINKKLTFHSARHTFATTITLTNGMPIETVSKMLGHNNLRTTQIYAKVIDAMVPLANMFGYINNLRSMSQGRAQYSMQFDHYEQVPQAVADEVRAKMA